MEAGGYHKMWGEGYAEQTEEYCDVYKLIGLKDDCMTMFFASD